MRVIGMDIHRTFAEAVMIDGDRLIRLGRCHLAFAVGLIGVGRALADCQRGCAPKAIAGGGIGCNPGAAARALRRHALGRN